MSDKSTGVACRSSAPAQSADGRPSLAPGLPGLRSAEGVRRDDMPQEKQRRPRRIYARLTEREYADASEQADAAALSLSEYLRRRLFGRRVVPKTDLRVLAELRRLGGLLKHIHNETRGTYSARTAEAIGALTACARELERRVAR